ncbi:MAG: hypothetical protein K2Q13_05565 [Nitrosomonas sp.]|uniref:hypothetical protein n=1 Tax=Nitrosomonas sp. TaxID=42353 RepID=UPI0025D85FF9|nr:hypothetical protein [Nitrosomonas sp.]MBY0474519.1 hypothetical protein [Nitrosomonas sp.]
MDTVTTKLTLWRTSEVFPKIYKLLVSSALNLPNNKALLMPILVAFFILGGCKTVPIQDRSFSDEIGFWEQDKNTSARFQHNSIADDKTIGLLYVSGKDILLNGTQVENSSKMKNNSFVDTGPYSSARIEFKASDSTCLIRVDEFNFGNAYTDTSDCKHYIETTHSAIKAQNAILHIHVSEHQTKIIVISGMIKVMLRKNEMQSIDVKEEQKIIITHDAINHPRQVAPSEIWQHASWKENHQFYKTEIDWHKVIMTIVTVAVVAAIVILLPASAGRRGVSHGHNSGHFHRLR